MKNRIKAILAVFIVFLTLGTGLKWLLGNANGPPDDSVKAPGDSAGCAAGGCHSSPSVNNSASADISLSGLPAQYVPGTTYSLTFTIANDAAGNNGFQVTASTGGTSRVGTWSNAGAGSAISDAYWKHTGAQTNTSWTADWTAPSSNIGTITFYAGANKGGTAAGGNLHFNNWSVPPEVITESTGAPTALKVTAISAHSITIAWTDTSNVEEGFRIIATTGGLYGTVGTNVTNFQFTGLSPNTLIQARISAFSGGAASTSTTFISSYTLANPPANLSFVSVGRTHATISWSSNSNRSDVPYEVSISTDNFVFQAGISTPVPFSSNLLSTSAVIGGLTQGGTYYFRVRARNGDSIATTFSSVISTVTQPAETIQSTGGVVDVGGTTLTTEAGVQIKIETLSDGNTQQTLLSTQSAQAVYGNGFTLTLPQGVETKVISKSNGFTLTSTQTIPVKESSVLIQPTSGTMKLESSAASLIIAIASGSTQNVQVTLSTNTTKSVSIRLNPPSGEISLDLPSAVFAESAALRIKVPDSFPAETLASAKQKALGIGVEILLDKSIQPQRTVPITASYRNSDIAGFAHNSLILSRFDETAQVWTQLPTKLDSSLKRVTGFTTHFSKFQLMSVSPASDILGVKVFPNPFLASKGHTEVKFTNLTADTSIKIYTLLGQLVRELSTDSSGRAFWDLKNNAGEEVASDVYFAMIEGVGGRKILKVGIQR